nr:hypothetical protein Iba_chr13bCG12930 [Ipomoea batatas]GMD78351.1 hypothetical protein Iba_chr13cCG12170 [Ipomoea batatas]GMD79743.1 hypothetical protein Iba_chr13dCG6910 [Ipomoea batatas]
MEDPIKPKFGVKEFFSKKGHDSSNMIYGGSFAECITW